VVIPISVHDANQERQGDSARVTDGARGRNLEATRGRRSTRCGFPSHTSNSKSRNVSTGPVRTAQSRFRHDPAASPGAFTAPSQCMGARSGDLWWWRGFRSLLESAAGFSSPCAFRDPSSDGRGRQCRSGRWRSFLDAAPLCPRENRSGVGLITGRGEELACSLGARRVGDRPAEGHRPINCDTAPTKWCEPTFFEYGTRDLVTRALLPPPSSSRGNEPTR